MINDGIDGASSKSFSLSCVNSYLYSSLLILADCNFVAISLVCFGAVIECLQLIAFLLSDDDALFAWNPQQTSDLGSILRLIDHMILIRLFSLPNAFIIVSVMVALLFSSLVIIGYQYDVYGIEPSAFRLRTVRSLISLFSSILYVPALSTLIKEACSSSFLLALVAGCFAFFYTIGMIICTVVLHDIHIQSRCALARAHSRFELTYISLKTVFPILFLCFTSSRVLLAFLAFASSSAVAIAFLLYIPYYNYLMVHLRCSLLSLLVWTGSSCLIGEIINDPRHDGSIYMVYGGAPLIIILTNLLVHIRFSVVREIPDDNLNNQFIAEAKFRLLLLDELGDTERSHLQNDKLVDEQKLICLRLIIDRSTQCFPRNALMLVISALFNFEVFCIPFLAYSDLSNATKCHPLLDIGFMVARLQRQYAQRVLKAAHNRDVIAYNRYVDLQSSATQHDLDLTRSLLSLWRELLQDAPDFEKLHSVAREISSQMTVAKVAYTAMMNISSESTSAVTAYAGFLTDLLHDDLAARTLKARVKDLNASKIRDRSYRTLLFSDDNAVIVISGDILNLGEILAVNDGARALFGVAIVGKNISVIVPEPISHLHTDIMVRNLSRGKGTVLDQTRRLIIRRQTGFVQDAVVYIKSFVDHEHLSFIGILEPIADETFSFIIVADQDLQICAISESAYDSLIGAVIGHPLNDLMPISDGDLTDRQGMVSLSDGSQRLYNIQIEKINLDLERSLFVIVIRMVPVQNYQALDECPLEPESKLIDRSSFRSDFGAYSNAPWQNVQVAMANRLFGDLEDDSHGEVDEEASLTESMSATARAVNHDGDYLVNIHDRMSKFSEISLNDDKHDVCGRNISVSSAFNDHHGLTHERVILLWLNRSSIILLVIVSITILSGFVFRSNFIDRNIQISDRISSSSSRSTDLISLSLAAYDLQLMATGYKASTDVKAVRQRISAFTDQLEFKVDTELRRMGSWSSPLAQLNYDPVSMLSNQTLTDSLMMSVAYSRDLQNMSLLSISANPQVVSSLIQMMTTVSERLFDISGPMTAQSNELSSLFSTLKLFVPYVSCICLLILTLFALRPSLIGSLNGKDQVFMKLFTISRACLLSIIQPCLIRLSLFTAKGDLVMASPNEHAFATDDISPHTAEARGHHSSRTAVMEHRRHPLHWQGTLSSKTNRNKVRRYQQLGQGVLIMVGVYSGIVAMALIMTDDILSPAYWFPNEMNWTRYEEYLIRRSVLTLQQVVVNETMIATPQMLLNLINQTSEHMNYLMYGNTGLGLPTKLMTESSQYFQLQFTSTCKLESMRLVTDCQTFRSGVANNGLHAILMDLLSLERQVLTIFTSGSMRASEILVSQPFRDSIRLEWEFLRPAVLELVDIVESDIASTFNLANILDIVFTVVFLSINVAMYMILVKPVLTAVAREFAEARDLFHTIPARAFLATSYNASVGSHHGSDDDDNPSESSEFDDRDTHAAAVHQANRKRRLLRIRRQRRLPFHRVYGCFRKYRAFACIASILVVLIIWLQFWPYAADYATADGYSSLLISIGSFFSGVTPVDPGILSCFLANVDSIVFRNTILVVQTVAALSASLFIILSGRCVDWTVCNYSTVGGMFGTALGLWLFPKSLVDNEVIAVISAAMMLGFASSIALTRLMLSFTRSVEPITSDLRCRFDIVVFGFCGGLISSVNGTGTGTFVFGMITLFFTLEPQIVLSTSILVSALNGLVVIACHFIYNLQLEATMLTTTSMMPSIVLMSIGATLPYNFATFFTLALLKFIGVILITWDGYYACFFVGAAFLAAWTATGFAIGVAGIIQFSSNSEYAKQDQDPGE